MNRTFLPDSALDAFLDACTHHADTIGAAVLDQADAATRSLNEMIPGLLVRAAETGHRVAVAQLPEDISDRKRLVLPAARMLFAALSSPPAYCCPHWGQIRPGVVVCDPPAFACLRPECLAALEVAEAQQGHRWDHECDACGQRTPMLWKNTRTIGPMCLLGHLCEACTEGGQLDVDVYAESVSRNVSRRGPCPCGSGRRYKACHGRAA
ncbi:SEC-C metal-binding domain-containing protein [Streptomyces sp. NPDC004546]|uniref:SEC-C metal-binding domain-containing protein n=1 Tax=Streptomyces sp. NPDC004546 TaxID=3154282 RepID=UPI0033BD57A8